ncbi:hypothetical protein ACFYRN_37615 [Streptomyces sp. NPDC005227]|uniref:hypothetical protein n=1 Tax=unclassified Streptomyces TaxID=2593676 RepID=UPI0036B1B029
MTAEGQQAGERIRFEAGERFPRGEKNVVIAKDLRVSARSVERTDYEHLERVLRRGLHRIQRHPELFDGCLAGTGFSLTYSPTTPRTSQ